MYRKPEKEIKFAGTKNKRDWKIPDWYRRIFGRPQTTLKRAITQVDKAEKRPILTTKNKGFSKIHWNEVNKKIQDIKQLLENNPENGEIEKLKQKTTDIQQKLDQLKYIEDHVSISNKQKDIVHSTATKRYTEINLDDFIPPLIETLQNKNMNKILGEIRTYDRDGAIYGEIYFDYGETQIKLDENEAYTIGIAFRTDHRKTTSLSCRLYGILKSEDKEIDGSKILLSSKWSSKHRGHKSPKDYREFWSTRIDHIIEEKDEIEKAIHKSKKEEIPFKDLPIDPERFFELLGIPNTEKQPVAEKAGSRAKIEANSTLSINFYSLHKGLAYALTHIYETKDGNTLKRHRKTLQNLIFNPLTTINKAKNRYEENQDTDTEKIKLFKDIKIKNQLENEKQKYQERMEKINNLTQTKNQDNQQNTKPKNKTQKLKTF